MIQFVLIAAATFISEDLTCIATGALIAAGKIRFLRGALACVAGMTSTSAASVTATIFFIEFAPPRM